MITSIKTNFKYFIVLAMISFIAKAEVQVDSTKVAPPVFTIVLDAGHGGKDSGKAVGTTYEKDIALNIVKKVGDQLSKQPNFKVIYTRTTDKFLELRERARIANDAKADFFVSVHANAAANKAARGNETFVLGLHRNSDNLEVVKRENSVILLEENYEEHYEGFNPNDPSSFATSLLTQEQFLDESIEMAAQVQTKFEDQIKRRNRGVKQAGFAVLRLSYMPSVLIETGFITNAEERKFLASNAGQQKVANAITKAILEYQKSRDINTFEVEQVNVESQGSTTDSQSIPIGDVDTNYMIQIAASKNKLDAKSYNFKKLPNISRKKLGDIYKYYTGTNLSLDQARELLKQAKSKGYNTAFIVKDTNGVLERL